MPSPKRAPPPRWTRDALAKAALMLAAVLTIVWNLSLLSVSVPPSRSAAVHGLHIPDAPAQNLRVQQPTTNTNDRTPTPVEATTPTPKELPWFLDPEWYKESSGCDFSAAVARFEPSELPINCDNIHLLKHGEFLGQGFWRSVYKAKWKGKAVAVKVVKKQLMDRNDIIPRHVEEAVAMFPIRNEPNIVSLVGWCNSTVVVEYVPLKLEDLVFDAKKELSVQQALIFARDAARGLAQLHDAPGGPYAHTDIQTRQFLIDWTGRLKLNDFNRVKYTGWNLKRGRESTKCLSQVSVAKGKWRAPEEYRKETIDEKVDVYSLSMVLWTLRSREKPFEDMEREQVYEKVPEGVRPPVAAMADYPEEMQQLIVQGWHPDPRQRPTANAYARRIDGILKAYVATQSKA